MKKISALILILVFVLALAGCGGMAKNDTPETLIRNYLEAVKDEDYEAIWNMIPSEIQNYAIELGIIEDREDGLDYIWRSVNDYYWLVSIDLPARDSYDFTITQTNAENARSLQQYLAQEGVKLKVEEAQYIQCHITADNDIEQDAAFYVIKCSGSWYMISVVGDDEVFEY